ncbi:MAG TPA: hypothetical protein VGE79_12770, partial [Niastella sp.]
MQTENIKSFKRLYVTVKKLLGEVESFTPGNTNEQLVQQVVEHTDTMIALLPFEFPTASLQYAKARILLVDIANPDAEPQEIVEKGQGYTRVSTPANTDILYESTIMAVLENWKFTAWNYFVHFSADGPLKEKYISIVMEHAVQYMERFPFSNYWEQWEKDMYVLYANQFGYFTGEREKDPQKLEAALAIVDKAFPHCDWTRLVFLKSTKVTLLLKLNRPWEAYSIVKEGLAKKPNYDEFQKFK